MESNADENLQELIEKAKDKFDDVRQKLQEFLINCDSDDNSSDSNIQLVEDVLPEEMAFLANLSEDLAKEQTANKVSPSKKNRKRVRKRNKNPAHDRTLADIVIEQIDFDEPVADIVDVYDTADNSIPQSSSNTIRPEFSNANVPGPSNRNVIQNSARTSNKSSGKTTKNEQTVLNQNQVANDTRKETTMTYNEESLLLMRLLFLTPLDREYFIMNEAKKCGFLVPNSTSTEYVLNKNLACLYENTKWMYSCNNTADLENFVKESSKHKRKLDSNVELSVTTIDSTVNLLYSTSKNQSVNNRNNIKLSQSRDDIGESGYKKRREKHREKEMKLKQKSFPMQLNKFLSKYKLDIDIPELKYFEDIKKNQRNIEKFADALCSKNIGYTVEGKLICFVGYYRPKFL